MKRSLVDDAAHFRETHERWLKRVSRNISRKDAPDEWFARQCFSCAYYLPLAGGFKEDWGVCSCARSERDGRATFEHDGCEQWEEAEETWHEEERMAEMAVEVSYGQLAVFDARMERPFNDWAEAHVAQGFSWRPGSVSFGTLQSGGTARVRVCRNEAFDEATSRAERILAVPFTVPSHGEVEIGSIAGGARIALPAGEYELVFEHGQTSEGGLWVSLWFHEADGVVEARVVRADSELDPPERLVMSATPARARGGFAGLTSGGEGVFGGSVLCRARGGGFRWWLFV